MPHLPLLSDQPENPYTRSLFERVREAKGSEFEMPALYRVLGHAPAMFDAWLNFAWPLREHAKTPRRLRELMILRGAQLTGTEYEWAHHLRMACIAGVSDAHIDELRDWRSSGAFDAQDRAALELAEEVTNGPGASAHTLEALRAQGFDDEALVELVLTASFYVCVGRVLGSLGIELEAGYEEEAGRM